MFFCSLKFWQDRPSNLSENRVEHYILDNIVGLYVFTNGVKALLIRWHSYKYSATKKLQSYQRGFACAKYWELLTPDELFRGCSAQLVLDSVVVGLVIAPYVCQCGWETNGSVDARWAPCVSVSVRECVPAPGHTEFETPSQMAAVNSTHTHSWWETHWSLVPHARVTHAHTVRKCGGESMRACAARRHATRAPGPRTTGSAAGFRMRGMQSRRRTARERPGSGSDPVCRRRSQQAPAAAAGRPRRPLPASSPSCAPDLAPGCAAAALPQTPTWSRTLLLPSPLPARLPSPCGRTRSYLRGVV